MHWKFLFAALLLAALPAIAQQRTPAATDAQASVPPLRFESVFTGYKPYQEPQIAPWRDVNDEVGRIGGHLGIMRGAGADQRDPAQKPPVPGAHKH